MGEFLGLINENLHDILIRKLEDVCKCNDYLHDSLPYTLCDGEFESVFSHIPEESSYGFIRMETFDSGEDVVLQGHDGCMRYQLCEVTSLTLTQSEQLLCLLMYDFLRPSAAVYFICLKEINSCVGRNQSPPRTALATADEEQAHAKTVILDVSCDVPAFKFVAIFHHLAVFKMPDERRSSEVLLAEPVLRPSLFSDLEHTQIVAFEVARVDEADNLLAGEPTVGKEILKADAFSDGTAYHLYGERNLVCIILSDTFHGRLCIITLLREMGRQFLLGHAVVALLSLLPDNGKVEKHLAHTIGDAHDESLETEDTLVLKVRVHASDVLHPLASLGKVGVINHQAGNLPFMVRADRNLVPQLQRDMIHQFAPVCTGITQKIIEHVLPTTQKVA